MNWDILLGAHHDWRSRFFALIWLAGAAAAIGVVSAPFALALTGVMEGAAFALYLQQIASGVAVGCVYALVALGLVLIYKATETINFAQGELLMLGAFFAYTAIELFGLPWWLGALGAASAAAMIGIIAERLVIRPLVGEPAFAIVMATIGLAFVARAGTSMVPGWGTDTYAITTPFANQVLHLGPAVISQDHAAVIAMTILMCVALYVFFSRTRLGIAMQAVSENQLAAYYMGIPVRRIFTLIWGLSAATAGVAGLLLAPIAFVHNGMGLIVFKAFAAAVVGGFGSLPGAVVGGLIIGMSEALAGFYLPEGFKDVAAYILLLLVLVVRPEGIFGAQVSKKV